MLNSKKTNAVAIALVLAFSVQPLAFCWRSHRTHGIHVWWKPIVTSTSTSQSANYATTSFAMDTNHTYIVAVISSDAASLVHTHQLKSGHTTPTWAQLQTIRFNTAAAPTQRISMWKGTVGARSTGTLTNNVSDNATGCAMAVYELTGTDKYATMIVQVMTNTGTAANAFVTLTNTVNQNRDNLVVLFVGSNQSAVGAPNATNNAVEADDINYSSPTTSLATYFTARSDKTTVSITNAAAEWGAVAAEIRRVTPPPVPSGDAFITGVTPGTPRSDFSDYVGFEVTPNANMTVIALGRWIIEDNTNVHTLKLVSGGTGGPWTDYVTTSIDASAQAAGQFGWVNITPVTLTNGSKYQIWSLEASGGDQFYDSDTVVTHTADGAIFEASFNSGGNVSASGGTNRAFVPTNFKYTIP